MDTNFMNAKLIHPYVGNSLIHIFKLLMPGIG
jgi:hypothetical protein